MKRITLMVLLLLLATFSRMTPVSYGQSALTDEKARVLAADAVAKATSTPGNQLNTKRREDLGRL